MSAYRFALIGSGWRASFYARIAEKMPDRFRLIGRNGRSRCHGKDAVE